MGFHARGLWVKICTQSASMSRPRTSAPSRSPPARTWAPMVMTRRVGPGDLAGWVVVRAGARRVVEVGIEDPGPLGPVPHDRRQLEDARHVGQEGVGVACTSLGAQVDVVELPYPDPLVLRCARIVLGRQPGRVVLPLQKQGAGDGAVHDAAR